MANVKRQNLNIRAGIVEGTGRNERFVSVAFGGMLSGAPIDGTRYNLAIEYARSHGMRVFYHNTNGVREAYSCDYETVARVAPWCFRCDKNGALKRTTNGALTPITTDFVGYYKRFVMPVIVDLVHADYTRRCGAFARYHAAVRIDNGLVTDGAVKTKKPRTTKRRGGRNRAR